MLQSLSHPLHSISTTVGRALVAGDGNGGMGGGMGRRGGFGDRGHGFPFGGLVFLAVPLVIGIVWFVGTRRGWFGAGERHRRQFDEWHRLAHAGPVPTGPSVMPPPPAAPVSDTPLTPPPAASADAPAPAEAPSSPVDQELPPAAPQD